jgi:hypothetical protein
VFIGAHALAVPFEPLDGAVLMDLEELRLGFAFALCLGPGGGAARVGD